MVNFQHNLRERCKLLWDRRRRSNYFLDLWRLLEIKIHKNNNLFFLVTHGCIINSAVMWSSNNYFVRFYFNFWYWTTVLWSNIFLVTRGCIEVWCERIETQIPPQATHITLSQHQFDLNNLRFFASPSVQRSFIFEIISGVWRKCLSFSERLALAFYDGCRRKERYGMRGSEGGNWSRHGKRALVAVGEVERRDKT